MATDTVYIYLYLFIVIGHLPTHTYNGFMQGVHMTSDGHCLPRPIHFTNYVPILRHLTFTYIFISVIGHFYTSLQWFTFYIYLYLFTVVGHLTIHHIITIVLP